MRKIRFTVTLLVMALILGTMGSVFAAAKTSAPSRPSFRSVGNDKLVLVVPKVTGATDYKVAVKTNGGAAVEYSLGLNAAMFVEVGSTYEVEIAAVLGNTYSVDCFAYDATSTTQQWSDAASIIKAPGAVFLGGITGLDVNVTSETTATVTWDEFDAASQYDITLNGVVIDNSADKTAETIDLTGLDVSKAYTVVVSTKPLAGSNAATRASMNFTSNEAQYASTMKITPASNGVTNKNHTGEAPLNKAVNGQSTHGSYQNNTNSCASCHQTHTASAPGLLFKATAYDACVACHDGTMGVYNVFNSLTTSSDMVNKPLELDGDNGAGTFKVTGTSMSSHTANDSLDVDTAPGAHGKVASAEFSCASCHNPHGSYSSRLLRTNTGGMDTVARTYLPGGTIFGNIVKKVPVYNALPTAGAFAEDLEFAAVRYTVLATDVDQTTDYYYGTGVVANDQIIQFYRWNRSNVWEKIPFATSAAKTAKMKVNGLAFDKANYTLVNNIKGFLKRTDNDNTKVTDVTDFVSLNVVKISTLGDTANVLPGQTTKKEQRNDITNWVKTAAVVTYSEWCGTCHVDYFASEKYGSGVEGNLYHHTVNSTSAGRNCAYCHFAHGTDENTLKNAVGSTKAMAITEYTNQPDGYMGSMGVIQSPTAGNITAVEAQAAADAHFKENNSSSALKRYVNMSVCYGCHTSSHSEEIIDNGTFGYGSPAGINAQWK